MSVDPSASVHASSIVEDGAHVGAGSTIGPFCIVGSKVRLGERVSLKSHVVIEGDTEIGDDTQVWPFASLGHQPQDLKFGGESSKLVIGARNMIRESVTMNPGTSGGGLVTRVGDDCLFMVNVHVGHDCQVGDRVVIANNVSLAGHVTVGNNVVIGGHSGIHQFVRIGQGAMIGVLSAVLADVVPYGTVTGDAARLSGLNLVGLKRRQTSKADMNELRSTFRRLFEGSGTLKERAISLREEKSDNSLIDDLLEFVLSESDRSFCKPDL